MKDDKSQLEFMVRRVTRGITITHNGLGMSTWFNTTPYAVLFPRNEIGRASIDVEIVYNTLGCYRGLPTKSR
jgi:hypothetical protein